MNIENIDKAIAVMERAKLYDSVNMRNWQTLSPSSSSIKFVAKNEQDLHACGNKACFAGHLAVSPEWLSTEGARMTFAGCPIYENDTEYMVAEEAISAWLGIQMSTAEQFIYGSGDIKNIYGVPWEAVKAEHVIRELTLLRDFGEEAYRASRKIYL